MTPDTFQYALENTRVIVPPRRRIETFGTSVFNYFLVTEEMDAVNESRVREGTIHAEKPQVITPSGMARLMLEGFGDQAQDFADWISAQAKQPAFLKYGFQIRKSDVLCYDVHEPLDAVVEKIRGQVAGSGDPLSGVITGVDDGWEVCLLKFTFDMVQNSAEGNLGDFKKRGLL